MFFDKQKANFNHFNELNLKFEHNSPDFKCLPGQKTGGASIQEGASIRMNTVHNLEYCFPEKEHDLYLHLSSRMFLNWNSLLEQSDSLSDPNV